MAVLLGALIVLAGIALGRMRTALPAEPTAVSVPDIAMPLDAAGMGLQIVANMQLDYALAPYPPAFGSETTLTLTPQDRRSAPARVLTATLEVAPIDQVDGLVYPMPLSDGKLVARGVRFPAAGDYRLRVKIDGIFPDESYVTIIVARVRYRNNSDIPSPINTTSTTTRNTF